jgi:hypothetical protein
MWLEYDNCEFRSDLKSRKGDTYSAYVLSGTKRGWKEAPDEPWSKTIFENTFVTVIDRKGTAEMVVNEFFDMCEPGDLIDVKQTKEGDFWKFVSLENKARSVLPEGTGMVQAVAPVHGQPSGWDAAVNFVNVLINNGHYKEKTNIEVLLEDVITYRERLDALESVALDAPIELDEE